MLDNLPVHSSFAVKQHKLFLPRLGCKFFDVCSVVSARKPHCATILADACCYQTAPDAATFRSGALDRFCEAHRAQIMDPVVLSARLHPST